MAHRLISGLCKSNREERQTLQKGTGIANLRLIVERGSYGRSPDRFFFFFSKFLSFCDKKGLEKNSENIFEEIEKISREILEREKNFKKNFRQIKKFQEKNWERWKKFWRDRKKINEKKFVQKSIEKNYIKKIEVENFLFRL